MNSNKSAYTKLFSMLLLTLGTQLILVTKSSRVAALFGTSVEMDAYNLTNSITGFLFSFFTTGIGTVLVPYMVRKDSSSNAQRGFVTILYGTALIFLGLFYVLRYPILNLFHGRSDNFVEIAASLSAIVVLYQFVLSLNTVPSAYLQCKNCFVFPKILGLTAALCTTIVVYLTDTLTIYQYVLLSFVMILGEMVAQTITAYQKGFSYRIRFNKNDPELKKMFHSFFPTVFGAGAYQMSLMADSMISTSLGDGNISVLSYSNSISGMVNTVIAGNIMLYIYPKIAAENNRENSKKKLLQYMTLFGALMCAVVVLFVAAGYDAVRILFERGKFQNDATQGVFVCVLIYLVGAPINVMRDVVYRYFYSKGNTKSTFYNGLAANILNIVISIILSRFMGLYGIVLGTTITAAFSFVSILLRMKKQYTFGGHFPFFAKELLKLIAATAAAVVGCLLVKWIPLGWPSLAVSALAALESLAIYGGVLFVSRSKVFQVELG